MYLESQSLGEYRSRAFGCTSKGANLMAAKPGSLPSDLATQTRLRYRNGVSPNSPSEEWRCNRMHQPILQVWASFQTRRPVLH
jgi:hypothetical protein